MVSLRTDSSVQNAIGALDTYASKAQTVLGSSPDPAAVFNGYLNWAAEAHRYLRDVLSIGSLLDLIETRGYLQIQSITPSAYQPGALDMLVRGELDHQSRALKSAADELRTELARWTTQIKVPEQGRARVGVFDTNMLMLHSERLAQLDWNRVLDVRYGETVALVVPQKAVQELDRLKRSTGTMRINGKDIQQRTLARHALGVIEQAFPGRETVHFLGGDSDGQPVASKRWLLLQLDDLAHEGLIDPDAEIIDRALSLRPFAQQVTLLTDDTGMRHRAEHAGLHAVRPQWPRSASGSQAEHLPASAD